MADTLALEKLVDDVAARFTADTTACTFSFGFREDAQQIEPPRIHWTPGDPGRTAGDLVGPKYPGQLPARPLWNLDELFTATITAYDASSPESHRAQWKAARFLLDAWLRAVYLAAYGTVKLKPPRWLVPRKERLHGASIQVVGAIGSSVPDSDATTAPVDTHANVTTTELGVSELQVIDPVP